MKSRIEPTLLTRLKRSRRRVRQREKRHHRLGGSRNWAFSQVRRPPDFVRLFAPFHIGLMKSFIRKPTLQFCQRLRTVYLHEKKDVILDFSKTRHIDATGMLVVLAEVDRSYRMGQSAQIMRCKCPEGDDFESMVVRQVLDQLEVLDRTEHPQIHQNKSLFDETVKHWRYATGTRVDDKPGAVLDHHEGRIAPALMTKMQIGLTEALVNSLHHAYNGLRDDGCVHFKERRWWMFTRELGATLEVMVCDLGIGIPRSLPVTWDRGMLKKLRAIFNEDHAHVAAVKSSLILGESSTRDQHRGKGLPQIWNAVQAADDGAVGIMSGKAYVGLETGVGMKSGSYDSQFLGTLISWRVPIGDTDGEPNG